MSERAEPALPSFARDYPDHPELTALVRAFEAGDHGLVRARAPKLVTDDDAKVARAARDLVARTNFSTNATRFVARSLPRPGTRISRMATSREGLG